MLVSTTGAEDGKMRVLVTGGAGFIGSNLCEHLLADGDVEAVRVLDDLSTGFLDNLDGLDVEFVEASILDQEAVRQAVAGCDAVVHLAALGSVPRSVEDPLASHHANVTGTVHVLQAAVDSGAYVVMSSSSSVYGANPTLPKHESLLCQPMSPYAVSKLAAESYMVAFGNVYGLPALPLRFFNVYGPRQRAGHVYAAVVPAFLDAAMRGEPLSRHGDGQQTRDFTYVGTVCEVLIRALKGRVTSGPTNLAFGTRVSLNDLIEMMEQQLGRSIEVSELPTRAGDVRHSAAANERLLELFPNLVPVPLEQGLANTITWMQDEVSKTR